MFSYFFLNVPRHFPATDTSQPEAEPFHRHTGMMASGSTVGSMAPSHERGFHGQGELETMLEARPIGGFTGKQKSRELAVEKQPEKYPRALFVSSQRSPS
jgi:hypothetical protein